ncbi:hypothetical protein H5410_023771 [Solanum commersonii]|uniref:DCD domain-containing protein n=1 Tax=Solanum commersonii TaxID=4109 RepID=A0A9J5ZIB2_SOLCO|nr:hypothetical protein H5410_023771 [Solanum commersonii]
MHLENQWNWMAYLISKSCGSKDLFSAISLFACELWITMELDDLFSKACGSKDLFSFILLFAVVHNVDGLHCVPLPEDMFRPIIKDNYFKQFHFWFELDHTQSSKLILQLSSLAYALSSTPHYPALRRSIIQSSPANNKIKENRSFEPQNLENKPSNSIVIQSSPANNEIAKNRSFEPQDLEIKISHPVPLILKLHWMRRILYT